MRTLDIAQLYLRISVGGMLLLHNINKFQNYNTIIMEYPQLEGVSSAFWFYLFEGVEAAAAVMIIIGWHIRFATAALIVGTILALTIYFPLPSMVDLELRGVYAFIYIYLFISGGGIYSFDFARVSK